MVRLANRNVLMVGAPGSGKTTAEVKTLVEEADRGDTAIVCIDPHTDSLAATFFAHLCQRGHRDRVLYDRLSDVDRVLKWDFLSPSTSSNEHERAGENDRRCRQFADVLMRRRGKSSMADTPGIEEWTLAALNLYMYQRRRRPLSDIRHAFSFDHPVFCSMLDGCSNEDVCFKFKALIDSRMTPYKAAERLITAVCSSPAFQLRTAEQPGFDLDRHLNNRGILILEGGEGGALSQDAMQSMMGAAILKTISYLRGRKREYPHVTLSLDEVNNAELIGEAGHEVRALTELRKYGLGMHILVQLLDFPSARVADAVMTTCATKYYFHTPEPRTAARLGEDLGGTFTTPGHTTRYYRDGSTFDVPTDVNNSYSYELRNLSIGECYVRRQNSTTKERITPLPEPFGFRKAPLRQLIEGLHSVVKQRPEYYSPPENQRQVDAGEPKPDGPQAQRDDDDPLGI